MSFGGQFIAYGLVVAFISSAPYLVQLAFGLVHGLMNAVEPADDINAEHVYFPDDVADEYEPSKNPACTCQPFYVKHVCVPDDEPPFETPKAELHPNVIVEDVPIEEDDDLRELDSPVGNETPPEGEWMKPICVRKFLFC